MSRYTAVVLNKVRARPIKDDKGLMLKLTFTEVAFGRGERQESVPVYCDDWHLKRLASALRKFPETMEGIGGRELKEITRNESTLPMPNFRWRLPFEYDQCFTLRRTGVGYGSGRNLPMLGRLQLETDFEDIPIQMSHDIAAKFASFLGGTT